MWRLFKKKEKSVPAAEKTKAVQKVTAAKVAKDRTEKADQPAVPVAAEKLPASAASALSVFIRPLSSEKTAFGSSFDAYAFVVKRTVNKIEISKAFAAMYKVKPLHVRTMLMPAKQKRRGRVVGVRPAWKKALIRVPKGSKIDVFSGV